MALDRDRLLKPVKKLRKLIGTLDSDPTPKQIHSLRTNARRFEATFNALSLDEHGIGKSVLKDLGRIRKRAGKVREMDVLTGFASTVHPQKEKECSVQLLEHLGVKRKKLAGRLLAEAKETGPSLVKELKRAKVVLGKENDSRNATASASEVTAAAAKLSGGLAKPQRLGRESLHPYRLKVKELSNVLKLGGKDSSRLIHELDKVKDAIGEWHDWEELISIARRVLTHGRGCGLLVELRRIAGQKYRHALALSRKLRKRASLPIQESRKSASAAVAA